MALGCIPISSYIGNLPNIINTEKTGYLIKGKPSDISYQKESAQKAIELLKDSEKFEHISNNAIEYAKKFTWSKAAEEFEKLL